VKNLTKKGQYACWSEKDIDFLKKNYKNMTADELSVNIGKTKSAVINKRHSLRLEKFTPVEIGKTYGRLVVIGKSSKRTDRGGFFNCKCECGKEKEIRGDALRIGATTSCGCYAKEATVSANIKPPGVATWTELFGTSRRGARQRNLPFKITIEEYKTIASQNCYYCGISPKPFNHYLSGHKRVYSSKSIERSWVLANGIDRVDNSLGYTTSNCVACCWPCNQAKMNKTVEEFLAHSRRIVEYQDSKKS